MRTNFRYKLHSLITCIVILLLLSAMCIQGSKLNIVALWFGTLTNIKYFGMEQHCPPISAVSCPLIYQVGWEWKTKERLMNSENSFTDRIKKPLQDNTGKHKYHFHKERKIHHHSNCTAAKFPLRQRADR